jgi:hypothetical protein
MHPAGRVFDESEDRTTAIAAQDIAGPRRYAQRMGARMFVRHELAEVVSMERPGVHHLLAVRIDNRYRLSGGDERGFAAPGGNFDE